MAYYNKIGLLIFNKDKSAFLVCQKYKQNVTDQWIMPGGQFIEDSVEECIVNEAREELSVSVDLKSITHIGTYTDVAAGRPERDVSITLYQVSIIGEPKPSTEVEMLHWISSTDTNNPRLSPIVRNKIMPDLTKRGLLKL